LKGNLVGRIFTAHALGHAAADDDNDGRESSGGVNWTGLVNNDVGVVSRLRHFTSARSAGIWDIPPS